MSHIGRNETELSIMLQKEYVQPKTKKVRNCRTISTRQAVDGAEVKIMIMIGQLEGFPTTEMELGLVYNSSRFV